MVARAGGEYNINKPIAELRKSVILEMSKLGFTLTNDTPNTFTFALRERVNPGDIIDIAVQFTFVEVSADVTYVKLRGAMDRSDESDRVKWQDTIREALRVAGGGQLS